MKSGLGRKGDGEDIVKDENEDEDGEEHNHHHYSIIIIKIL